MKSSINLSLAKRQNDIFYKRILYIVAGIFLLTVIVSIGLLIFRIFLNSSFQKLSAQEQDLNQQLKNLLPKKEKFRETEKRLGDIRKVISTRSQITNQVNTLSSIISDDLSLSGINGTENVIQMSVVSDNLSNLNDLVQNKAISLAQDKKKGVQKIEMDSFTLNPKTHQYTVVFGVTFLSK